MAATDRLKAYRQSKATMPPMDEGAEEEESKPSDRSVMLTQMEQKAFAGTSQPGTEVQFEGSGRLDGNGKLDIIEIRSQGGPVDAAAGMPVRTNPALAPS
jgi:hypothetical protein